MQVQAIRVTCPDKTTWDLQCILGCITDSYCIKLDALSPKRSIFEDFKKPVTRYIWLTSSDLLDDDSGPYGIPWDTSLEHRDTRLGIIHTYKLDNALFKLKTWYHGTDAKLAEFIVEKSRLRASPVPAMLGQGVYFGSFWKACRYAMFENTRDWSERRDRLRGSVIRSFVRILPDKVTVLPNETFRCMCTKCMLRIRDASTPEQRDLRDRQCRISDHESQWIRDDKYAIELDSTLGTMSHTESCVRDDRIRFDVVSFDYGEVDLRTRTDPYDPKSRHHRIIVYDVVCCDDDK